MPDFFDRMLENRRFVSLVGGGGKTTTMLYLARRLAAQGRRAAVITSTRIYRPADYAPDIAACRAKWAAGTYPVCGTAAENGKLALPGEETLRALLAEADVVLCEADGAKRLPCKAPAAHEPVILPETDLVIAVMGLSALGKRVEDCCLRVPQVCALLGCGGAHVLTPADMAALLVHEAGARKGVGGRAFAVVLNQCDDAARRAPGMEAARLLMQHGQTDIALTALAEERIIWTT